MQLEFAQFSPALCGSLAETTPVITFALTLFFVFMLILVSDLHLTDGHATPHVPRAALFDRFWERIDRTRKGGPVEIAFIGDLFDVVRSPKWLQTSLRPYHADSTEQRDLTASIVDSIISREQPFFDLIRRRVREGTLSVSYVIGNHDRLIGDSGKARSAIRMAFTGQADAAEFPSLMRWPEYGVLAHHGHTVDELCHERDGSPPLGDAVGSELIVKFPMVIRRDTGMDDPQLDDIDDVRPIYAVPSWVRTLAAGRKGVGRKVGDAWRGLVEEFFSISYVKDWFKDHHRPLSFDFARKVRTVLSLSAKRTLGVDQKIVHAYNVMFHWMDGRFAQSAATALARPENKGLCHVVNGHSHFAAMQPLGNVNGLPSCYFNTGTWRTVHQLGSAAGTPAFLAYDSMAYLVFFPKDDRLGRKFEWWTGAMVGSDAKP
jgi:UDP-2,3-diacylglucosamine pyrophosphatase LpxH